MSIIGSIKDTARKATNSVVDTAENIVDKLKTLKELAKRLGYVFLSKKPHTSILPTLQAQ